MAGAAFYTSRVNRQVVAAPAPQPALGIGDVVSALGRTAGAIADQNRAVDERVAEIDAAIAKREEARQRDKVSAEVAIKLAESEGTYARWVIDNQNDAQFESKANAKVETDLAELRGMLGSDTALLDHYEPVFARMGESRKTAAFGHVAAIRSKAAGDATAALLTASGNAIDTDPAKTEDYANLVTANIMANQSIPEALRPGLAHKAAGELWQRGLEANIRAGKYGAVGEALNAGTYDAVLPEGAKPALLRLVDASQAVAARAEADAASATQRAASDALKALRERLDNDPDSVPAAEITAALAAGKAAGLPQHELLDAGYLATDKIYDRNARALATPDLTAQVNALRAKRDGGKLKGPELRMLERAEKELKDRATKAADTLSPLLKGGPAQRKQGVDQLAVMPFAERKAAAREAGDVKAGMIAGLGERGRAWAVQGAALRHDRPLDFLPPLPGVVGGGVEVAGRERVARQAFDRLLGEVKDDTGGEYAELFDSALDVMAGSGGKWNAANFETSVQVLAGRSYRPNGAGPQGGIGTVRGKKVELPPQWNEAEFDHWYSRNAFAGAIYDNGKPVSPADVRARFRLQYAGDAPDGGASYLLLGPNRAPLAKADGSAWVLTVSAKPPPVKR